MKHYTFVRRSGAAGAIARTGLVGITAGLVLAGGTAAGASASTVRVAHVSAGAAGQSASETIPAAPTGLVATAGAGQVTLSWVAPAGSEVTSYNIYAGGPGLPGGRAAYTGVTGTSYVVPGLRANTTYNFEVAAVNAAGHQGALSSVSATTKPPVPPPAPPGAPAGLKATAGQGQVTLSWVAPAGSEVTSYNIYAGGPGFPVGTPAYTGVTGTSYVVPNLRAGTTYNFKVAAVNARGAGPVSPVTSITLPLPPVLRAPGDVEARPGRTRVVVLWTPPTASGGAKVSGYRVYMGTRPGGESRTPVTKALVRYNAVVVKGLDSTTRYYFKVAAVDTTGRLGALSDEVSAVPWPAVAPTPTRSGSAGPGSTGPGSGQGSATGPVEVVPIAGQSSQDLPQDQSSPGTPTWLIILLAGVAGAALAGAVGIAAHLRRLRIRQGMPGAFGPGGPGAPEELDNRPLSGPRYR